PSSPSTGTPGEGWGEGFSGILPPPVSQQAVQHYCDQEWATHLQDVMIRRTSWRYYHRDHMAIAQQVARWMQQPLGWSDDRGEEELDDYKNVIPAACGFADQNTKSAKQVQHA